jgi:putative phosphoribosyl transferase
MRIFRDRRDAGRALAAALAGEAAGRPVVLGLARGGVPVAAEIAAALGAPLDVFVVRKLGVPWQPELAMGAIASGGVMVRNEEVLARLPDAEDALEAVREREAVELAVRERRYRGARPPVPVAGRPVIVVDDGLATGASMAAAVRALRKAGATSIVVAVPVGPPETCRRIAALCDRLVCLEQPRGFMAVGQWYEDFGQTQDEEVGELLAAAGTTGQDPALGSTPGAKG